MKLLSELGSCFYGGGSTVSPPSAAEACWSVLRSSSRLRDDQKSGTNCSGGTGTGTGSSHELAAAAATATVTGLRKYKSTNTSRNWKPKLHVISEDSVVMMNHHDSSEAVRSDNKLSVKVKAKSKPKLPTYVSADDYWYFSSNF